MLFLLFDYVNSIFRLKIKKLISLGFKAVVLVLITRFNNNTRLIVNKS